MQAEQVIGKILSDARAQAETIRKEARQREAAETKRLDEELARFQQETQALAGKAAADERSQRLAVARMEAAKEYLAGKTGLLGEVFTQARQQIEKLADGEYRALMARLMAQAAETGEEQVIPGRADERIDKGLVDEVNTQLAGKGKLVLAEPRYGFARGFLLQRGKVRTNVSLDVLVEQARKDLEIEVARDLFSEPADAGRPQ